MGEGGSQDPDTPILLDECPFCGGQSFSKQPSLGVKECLHFLCGDCRFGYRIWLDDRSPEEATIQTDWAAQVPRD